MPATTGSSRWTPTPTAAPSPTAIARTSGKTVRDLVRARGEITGYAQVSAIVARDETRLDVLASDADPRVSEAFSDRDYNDVASLAAHYYSFVLTDTGTGIVHSVMAATLDRADQLVVVSGLSVDEARLASETLTWLETNGYAEQVRGAVVVLNNARPGAAARAAGRARDALQDAGARGRAGAVRPAHRGRQRHHVPRSASRDAPGGPRTGGHGRRGSARSGSRGLTVAVRPIRLFGDPVLRTPSAAITDIDEGIRALVQDLIDTVELPGRAGVAAPQIGVGLRAFSYNIDGDIGYILNPEVVEVVRRA